MAILPRTAHSNQLMITLPQLAKKGLNTLAGYEYKDTVLIKHQWICFSDIWMKREIGILSSLETVCGMGG